MLSSRDILTSSGKFPEREKYATEWVVKNIERLCICVNGLFVAINYVDIIDITSGFRTQKSNLSAGGSKKSYHLLGLAVDIKDSSGDLGNKIMTAEKENGVLKNFGLWLEHPDFTHGWVHLDLGQRKERPVRIFVP